MNQLKLLKKCETSCSLRIVKGGKYMPYDLKFINENNINF